MKVCSKCKVKKPYNEFYRDSDKTDGYECRCKICHNNYLQTYRKSKVGKKATKKANQKYISSEKGKKMKRKYFHKHYKKPMFRLNHIFSSEIWHCLKANKAGKHWELLVGYTLDELKKHLEKQFTKGMTWGNHGKFGWHIEHKIPKSVFNFAKFEHIDFKRCWALSNLQPMWAEENNKKHTKLEKPFQPSLKL